MKYYYDIYLNFNEYPIQYYEWSNNDSLERYMKLPIFRVDNISDYIKYHMDVDIDISPFIISDGINALALELIDKDVAYLSYLSYSDETCVNEVASNLSITKLKYKKKNKRDIPFTLRLDMFIQKILLKKVEESNNDFIHYIYYDITGYDDIEIDAMRNFLMDDIKNNFNDKYVNLYQKICK